MICHCMPTTCCETLKMTVTNIFIAYLALICFKGSEGFSGSGFRNFYYGGHRVSKSNALTPKQVATLVRTYNLGPGPIDPPFYVNRTWQSEELQPDGRPQAVARLLVLNDGVCGVWTTWTVDRYFHWHEGQAVIDKISPNGTRVSECVGSTVLNADCKYVVVVPKGTYADVRTVGDLAILTHVLMNGDITDGTRIEYADMLRKFGDQHGDIIRKTRKCYGPRKPRNVFVV